MGLTKGHVRRLVFNDVSMQNLQLFFSLSKRLFLGLYELDILACEPVNAVVLDILSDGRLSQLKQLSFVGKSLYESYNLTSICLKVYLHLTPSLFS